jgi:UDP-glucose 4-epimerase
LDDLSVGRKENVPDGVRLVVGDILDADAVAAAVSGCEVLFHLAARVAIRSSFEFVVEDTMANVVGTANVLRTALRSGRVRRVVATSSMAVYADASSPRPIDEDHPREPVSPYGISKLAAERLTHGICGKAGVESAVLRLFNTFGPGQTLSPYVGVVTIFVNRLRAGQAPIIFGDGEQCRDFVHVEDVASAFLAAMDAPSSGETFNVGSGAATSINHVFYRIREAMGSTIQPMYGPAAPGELRYSIADIGKAARLLGYRPRRSFDSGIEEVVSQILGG